jgi:hypothetical protein
MFRPLPNTWFPFRHRVKAIHKEAYEPWTTELRIQLRESFASPITTFNAARSESVGLQQS